MVTRWPSEFHGRLLRWSAVSDQDDVTAHLGPSTDALGRRRAPDSDGDGAAGGASERSALAPMRVALGRYILLSQVGRGGGGVVYGAYDPELDRRVAIKVLRPDVEGGSSPDWADRMRSEAQTIAQLSHPNIIAVHDVGTIEPGHPMFDAGVFIVMELIDGSPLSTWIDARRPWSEVLDVLLPIGHALIAAHAAGLVHRDVKPANVLVAGDARPRLVDFGLARPLPRTSADAEAVSNIAIGTPSTMAPEQHFGRAADARTDQYGYCATLHALLHGDYPFAGDTIAELLRAKERGRPRQQVRGIPRWLDEAVARGLAPRPEDRYPDMAALLHVLERGRGRVRRRLAIVAGTGVLVGSIAISRWSAAGAPAEQCTARGEERIATVWGPTARDGALGGLRATAVINAEQTATIVERTVEDVLARWRIAQGQVCESTVAGDGDRVQDAGRLACLDGVLDEIEELAALLAAADEQVVRGAANAALRLSRPEDCIEIEARHRTDPALELTLRRARLHLSAGRFDEAGALAEQALATATALGDDRAIARAHFTSCRVLGDAGHRARATSHCEEAVLAAERGNDDAQVLRSLILLVKIDSDAEAARWNLALAEARMLGTPQRERSRGVEADVAMAQWRVHSVAGREAEAAEAVERAIELFAQANGRDDVQVVPAYNGLGITRRRLGQLHASRAAFARALELTERTHGEEHPSVGLLVNNLAEVALDLGEVEEATRLFDRAIELKQAAYGVDAPLVATSLQGLARARIESGRPAEALEAAQRQHRIARVHAQPRDAMATSDTSLATALVENGRCAEALALVDDAEAATIDARLQAEIAVLRGRCARAAGDPEAAAEHLRASLERSRSRGLGEVRDLVSPLLVLAQLERDRGERDQARQAAAQAEAICRATEGDPRQLAQAQAILAGL